MFLAVFGLFWALFSVFCAFCVFSVFRFFGRVLGFFDLGFGTLAVCCRTAGRVERPRVQRGQLRGVIRGRGAIRFLARAYRRRKLRLIRSVAQKRNPWKVGSTTGMIFGAETDSCRTCALGCAPRYWLSAERCPEVHPSGFQATRSC